MRWEKAIYGVEMPSRRRRVIVYLFWVLMALGFFGYSANYLPEPPVDMAGLVIAVVFGLLAAVWVVSYVVNGDLRYSEEIRSSWFKKIFVALLVAGFAGFVSRAALGHGVPGLWVQYFGEEYVSEARLTMAFGGGRYSCRHRLVGEAFTVAMPSFMCVSKAFFDSLPRGESEFILKGRTHRLGKLVLVVERKSGANK